MINQDYTYAIIGASNNEEKYGNKILKDLLNKKFNLIPINPKEKEILGLNCYATLSEFYENKNKENKSIDVVIFVVPPKITEKILFEVKKLNINKVWMQPGSESEKAINFCKENNLEIIYNSCIMVKTN